VGKDVPSGAEREGLMRLHRQVRQQQMLRDIPAKATAWFAGSTGATSELSFRLPYR
jgi:transposase